MCSDPYFIIMKPNTLEVINAVWAFRKASKIPVCFTLDAVLMSMFCTPKNTPQRSMNLLALNWPIIVKTNITFWTASVRVQKALNFNVYL